MVDHIFKPRSEAFAEQQEELGRCIVRLSTSCWDSNAGIFVTRRLVYLKRKCKGFNILEEERSNLGDPESVISRIVNLNECEDGVYHVIECNVSYDWEGGYLDDFDFKLIPYVDEEGE